MTAAVGDATSIGVPETPGTYRLLVVEASGRAVDESEAILRVTGG